MNFHNVFQILPDNLIILAPEPGYPILAMNEAYLATTMREREELIGKKFLLEAFPDNSVPYDQNPVKLSLDRAAASKQPDHFPPSRYDIPNADGTFEVRYWEAVHMPVLDENSNLLYLVQKTTDVTEREKAKRDLWVTENKFRFMAETLPQLIFTTDADGNLTYMNQRWTNYTGIPIEELKVSGWEKVIHPDEYQTVTQRWQESFEKGEEIQIELRKRGKDGNYRWFLCKSLPMRDKNGEIVMWSGSCTDIHDMRKLVQELLESNEQMSALSDQVHLAYRQAEKERKTLEHLIMKAPAFVCILEGPQHHFKLVNDKYQALFPKRELLDKTVAEAIPEVVDQGFIQILDNVYQTGKEFIAHEIPVKLDRLDTGNLQDEFLTFIYQPLYDENERITGILVFGYEVNEQVKYRKKLQELGQE